MKKLRGSVTVEASFVIPTVIAVIFFVIMMGFLSHDRAVIRGAVNEAGSACMMLIRAGAGTDEANVEQIFDTRIKDKLIVVSDPQVTADVSSIHVNALATGEFNLGIIPLIGSLLKSSRYMISEKAEFTVPDPEDNIRMTMKVIDLLKE